MLKPSKDIFQTICKNLGICDINTFIDKSLKKNILLDNAYWANQFQIHFPHLANQATQKGQLKNWYLAFEKAYIDEYKFNIPHSGSLVELQSTDLAALFTAAKSGNASEFKKYYLKASSGYFDIEPLFYSCDKHGYSCYDWLYQSSHQNILDDIFATFNPKLDAILLTPEQSKLIQLNLAVVCNQKSYLEEHTKNISFIPSNLFLLAVKLGSLDLVKLLVEKEFNNPEITISKAFILASSHGRTQVAEFLHEKIIQFNDLQIKQKYKSMMYEALQEAMFNQHKKTFETLLEIAKKNHFDINYVPQTIPKKNSILSFSAKAKDADYVQMVLASGTILTTPNIDDYSALEEAIYNRNHETLVLLLQKGIEFDNYDYARVKNWLMNSHHNENEGMKRPETSSEIDQRMRTLVELALYKYEIKNEKETTKSLKSWMYGMFHIERPQDKIVKLRAYDKLFEIIIGKRASKDLQQLKSIEKTALENQSSQLAGVYQNLSNQMKKLQKEKISTRAHI